MPQSPPLQLLFTAARLLQGQLNTWAECRYHPCRSARRCLGGPRGTCRKTGGWPLCSEEGEAREKIAGNHRFWPGENVPECETVSERRWRRFQRDMERLRRQMIMDG